MNRPNVNRVRDYRLAHYPRFLWFLALAIQLAGLAYMSGQRVFPATMLALALAGLPGRVQWRLTRTWKFRLTFLLVLLPVVTVLLPRVGDAPVVEPMLPYAHAIAIAQYCVALQVAQFFLARADGGLPPFVPLLGLVTLLLAGNRSATPSAHFVYRVLSLGFGVLAIAYWEASARRRRGAGAQGGGRSRIATLALLTVMTCALAWFGGFLAIQLEADLVRFFGWLQGGAKPYVFEKSAAGFSSRPLFEDIRKWKMTGADDLALRVYSADEPGYLRGRVFTEFSSGPRCTWTDTSVPVTEMPTARFFEGLPARAVGENLFEMRPDVAEWGGEAGAKPQWRTLDVRPVQQIGDAIFSPLGAGLLAARLPFVQVASAGVVQTIASPKGGGYRVFVPPARQRETLTSRTLSEYLRLPDDVDPRIRQLAEDVLAGSTTSREKMIAVANYFRTNYEYRLYRLYTTVPKGIDLITYFLTEKPPGHCEYFATGAAILLRLGGVPCRYVSGFVVDEKNGPGGYWVGRNRDAHAWVEAYDSETRTWRIVEATPSSGVPSGANRHAAGRFSQWWDAAKAFLAGLRTAFLTGELKAWFLANWAAERHWIVREFVWILAFAGLAVAAGVMLVGGRRKRRGAVNAEDAAAASARLLLERVDRLVARHGLRRQPSETLHRFAERILAEAGAGDLRVAADWYRQYANLRYGAPLDEAALVAMRAGCPRSLPRSEGGARSKME